MAIGDWDGGKVDPQNGPVRIKGADEEIARIYRHRDGRAVELYIGYFASQEQGKELINYRSHIFHRGAVQNRMPARPGQYYYVNRMLLQEERPPRVLFFLVRH